ncbi:MAG: nucleotidyltransferase domain-containing protein [Candidatus Syntrophoarchaeum sp.]|nr:nucleotidyltransferase domain-containing protein [Candidatus Syntrophoarchaeum sp.]
MILKDEGKLPKDDYTNIEADFAFLAEDERIIAVLLFGSGAKEQADERSDRDFCIVAPEIRNKGDMRAVLRKIYGNIDVNGKRYDIWLFEELPLYMKVQVIENHKVVFCRDLPSLYEYFYFYRKVWGDQKHRQELDKEELMEILEKKPFLRKKSFTNNFFTFGKNLD